MTVEVYVSALARKNSFSLTLGLCRRGDEAEDELHRLCALVLMDTFENSPTETTVAKVT